MNHYYNEFDPYCAQWLRNLIEAGHIPKGEVDERSIVDVAASDLSGFRQCHFFAGIGGWALAARIAGWPEDRELWTGSCPCQPFSQAGDQRGFEDERHLWPHQLRLLRARRPDVWMGEQVAAAVGKHWLDGVLTDLEAIDYACRSVVLPACSVDGPHGRDRIWVVGRNGALDHGVSARLEGHAGDEHCAPGRAQPDRPASAADGSHGVVADSYDRNREEPGEPGETESPRRSYWANPDHSTSWVIGHDGKARRVQPGLRLLVDGVPSRVGRLRAYGNAIVPQVAAEVIAAYMDCAP